MIDEQTKIAYEAMRLAQLGKHFKTNGLFGWRGGKMGSGGE